MTSIRDLVDPSYHKRGKNQCAHGNLARSCIVCELERENARLNKVVSDMLAALQLINVDKDGDGFVCREAMYEILAVIAQATGGAAPCK
jgi:hypothetical protein